ncbi:MAG: hypothetical protein ACTICX_05725 [Lactobacillus helveticus]|uniref:hypothetical protein n=1 Tax=Lactobacillus helveticus TaxID=1587 RepID=UPI001562A9E9|nr:hypothetical protein [Lactobacillus helveticus]NRO04867.1 hypothetical protein [Lactobacillus helveticus]NRO39542.1 hypothetical protein [Lactobacillus helveticus]NRO76911.1 hypothetical protein [Lactobacillus helveticus]
MRLKIERRSASDVCDKFSREEASYGKFVALYEWIITDADKEEDNSIGLELI